VLPYQTSANGYLGIAGRKKIYRTLGREIRFRSIASAAAPFRDMCGSMRRPPARSRQRCPTGTPQVGQGTEDNCFLVSFAIFIRMRFPQKPPQNCPIWHIWYPFRTFSKNQFGENVPAENRAPLRLAPLARWHAAVVNSLLLRNHRQRCCI